MGLIHLLTEHLSISPYSITRLSSRNVTDGMAYSTLHVRAVWLPARLPTTPVYHRLAHFNHHPRHLASVTLTEPSNPGFTHTG